MEYFCNHIHSLQNIYSTAALQTKQQKFKKEDLLCIYRAPFARASDAGCDLPHSLYNSEALLKKSATSFQFPNSFARAAADSICLAASQGLLIRQGYKRETINYQKLT